MKAAIGASAEKAHFVRRSTMAARISLRSLDGGFANEPLQLVAGLNVRNGPRLCENTNFASERRTIFREACARGPLAEQSLANSCSAEHRSPAGIPWPSFHTASAQTGHSPHLRRMSRRSLNCKMLRAALMAEKCTKLQSSAEPTTKKGSPDMSAWAWIV